MIELILMSVKDLRKTFDEGVGSVNKRFDNMETQFSTINTKLGRIIAKREGNNGGIRQLLKGMIENNSNTHEPIMNEIDNKETVYTNDNETTADEL